MAFHWAGWILTFLALCGVGYTLLAARLVARFGVASRPGLKTPPVTILKPLHFDEPGLKDALRSFLDQDYAAPVQLVFGVQDHSDPAIAVVEALQRDYPERDIALVVDPSLHGTNRKISNLINMHHVTKHDVVVLSDSDISVGRDWLAQVVAALTQDGVGAVTSLYVGKPGANGWSVLAAMGSSYEFLPNVVAGVSWGLAAPCLGSTIAFEKHVLDETGGFRTFANLLADDYEIGRAIRRLGFKIAVLNFAVAHTSAETTWPALYRHELRWNRTTRVIDPWGHTGSVITHPLPLALLGVILTGGAYGALAVAVLSIASRLWLKACVDRRFSARSGPAWALPIRDILSFGVFVSSFFGDVVHWRGNEFGVSPSGALSSHEAL
jgi:ceramide glucosyltransferase